MILKETKSHMEGGELMHKIFNAIFLIKDEVVLRFKS